MACSIPVLSLLVAVALLVVLPAYAGTAEKVSTPGEYSGYSYPIYDDWERISQYVIVQKDTDHETKLAVDIFFPKKDGKLFYEELDENGQPVRLPVIWTDHVRHRADVNVLDGSVDTELDRTPWLQEVIKHGYVIGVVDRRGSGASYGTRLRPFSDNEARDAYEMTEWFAKQNWCNENIGMFGRSAMGINQYMCAGLAPPHLKCIVPEMAMFDLYSFVYAGGVYHSEFLEFWSSAIQGFDLSYFPYFPVVAPVDEDSEGIQRAAAISEHEDNYSDSVLAEATPYRDSVDPDTGEPCYFTGSPSRYLDSIKESGVGVYNLGGWFDMWVRDTLVWYNNLNNPQKITIGPWYHLETDHDFLAAEHLRWYDYWLKGIENGVMTEQPIYYSTMGASEGNEWRSAAKWPLSNELKLPLYFKRGPTGSVNSTNDGYLSLIPPFLPVGKDEYEVQYDTTTGLTNRWTNGHGFEFDYPDMTENDENGLTYTSCPLFFDVQMTGHPVVHLWVTSTASNGDGDFFVYLEEVDKDGFSHYITEGTLRASHRKTKKPSFEYMGLPWHPSLEKHISLFPNKPVKLVFDLHPTSNIFDAGHRIRVTITCSDQDNYSTPVLDPSPNVTVYRNKRYSSYIMLPFILTWDNWDMTIGSSNDVLFEPLAETKNF